MISDEKQIYLGSNVSPTVLAELDYRGLLDAGEQLLAVFDGMLLDEQQRKVGGLAMSDYLVLSDQRLISWARGLWTDTIDGFGWSDVELLDAECWDPYHGRIVIGMHLPAPGERPQRRVSVRGPGLHAATGGDEVALTIFDMMPAEDVAVATEMLQWLPEQLATLAGAELLEAFAHTFPAPVRQPRPRMVRPTPALPPAPEPPKSRWPFGRKQSEAAVPGNIVGAYEQQRGGGSAGAEQPAFLPPMLRSGGPQAPEQPTVYDLSRGLKMVMQHRDKVGPVMSRLTRAMARMSDVVGGSADLVENMRDPDVRRVAGAGLRQAMGQQGGPSTIGAISRAARRRDDEAAPRPAERSSRRIEVRSSLRAQPEVEVRSGLRSTVRTNVRSAGLGDEAEASERQPLPEQLGRRVTMTRIEPVAEALDEEEAPERISVPIRRVVRSRNDD